MLLSYALDILPTAPVAHLAFEGVPQTRIELGDSLTILAMCSDGALLAIRAMSSRELIHLIRQKRLMDVVLKLRERSQWAYVVLIGNISSTYGAKLAIDDNPTDWEWSAVQGALLSIQEAGVGVWQVGRDDHLPTVIETLAKRDRTPNRVRPARQALFVSPAEDMLLALPDIGDERCTALLQAAGGSGAYALVALTDPAFKVAGIGPAIKAKARQALGLAETMTFTVVEASVTNGTGTADSPDAGAEPAAQQAA